MRLGRWQPLERINRHNQIVARVGVHAIESNLKTSTLSLQLPHHKLIAYQVAAELLQLVARIRMNDAKLRHQARKSTKSAVLNTAEGAARQRWRTRAAPTPARWLRAAKCCAAVEVAGMLGACSPAHVQEVLVLGVRLKNLLSRLIR